ncbi:MAG: FimV/HubP family polar landmark protein [Betaproteobacteria bacterium]
MRAKPIHTISLLASALAMALPSTTLALGLGRLTVQSSLGQPLAAQIELTSATRDELDSLAAKVADPGLYRQNNLSYQGVLARARITLERTQGGQAYLRVATASPVNEPYLDLMVELNWSAGRVVREYTFLLDPPGLVAATPAVDPVAPVRGAGAPARAAPAASASASTSAGIGGGGTPARAEGQGRSSPGTSYTVRRGDSLARIAGQSKPDGVSLEQMLVALFKSNPEAFDGDNMNRLRSGSILKIPGAGEVEGTAPSEASRVVRMQASDWRTYRDRLAAGAPASEGAGGRQTGGRITTAVEERTPAAAAGGDQVRVSKEAAQGRGASATAEDIVARDRALKDAQARIADLEKTLKDLQRVVELRNPTMAQLQTQADAGKAKGTAPALPAPAPTATAVPGVGGVAEAPKASTVAKAEPMAPPKIAEPVAAAPAAVAGVSSPTGSAAPAAVAPAAKTEPPKAPAKTVKAEPASSPSMVDDMLTNTPTWVIGAGALALLAGFAALFAARRRKTANFEDSIISGTDIKSNTVFGSTGGGIVNTGENSLSSDFSREGLSSIDTDEVDPIAEAEVYLAYGRDAQAEEILKDALKKDAQRQDVYLKLLEIHAQHNKPSAFEAVAADLFSVSHGQGDTWHKAVALGRQLDPNNPMFAEESTGAGAGAVAAAAVVATGAAAIGAAVARHEPADPSPLGPAAPRGSVEAAAATVPTGIADTQHDRGMDFQLDEDISISPTSGAVRKSAADILAGAQSELDKTERHLPASRSGGATPGVASGPGADASRGADSRFDLDFHLDDRDPPASARAAGATASSLARPQAAIDLDKLDLSFDPGRTTFEDPTPSVLDGQWHDAATKLDLAKAYQEMGDIEGAREILQEVLHEGDDQQKGEAGTLLEKLG